MGSVEKIVGRKVVIWLDSQQNLQQWVWGSVAHGNLEDLRIPHTEGLVGIPHSMAFG